MIMARLAALSSTLLIVWLDRLSPATATVHHGSPSSSSSQTLSPSRQDVGRRAGGRATSKPNNNDGLRRGGYNSFFNSRQLSVADQLCILKLGFIPASYGAEPAGDEDSSPTTIYARLFTCRGGGMDIPERRGGQSIIRGDIDGSSVSSCRRRISTEDQLNILKLGFIPISSAEDSSEEDGNDLKSNNGIMAIFRHRGGGMDDGSRRARPAAKISRKRQLSVEDQLDILKLGFVPTSSEYYDNDHRPSSNVNAISHFESRGGGSLEDDTMKKLERAAHLRHLVFASIMAFLAGYSDVICLKQFSCYAAMMSGNIVMTSISLAEQQWAEARWRLSLVGSYFIGAAFVRYVELMQLHRQQDAAMKESKQSTPNQHLKFIAPIVAALFAIANRLILSSTNNGQRAYSYMQILALGYGMTYASANRALNATITQLLTGHVTKLGGAISDRIVSADGKWIKGTSTSVCILGSFIGGGILGTLIEKILPMQFPYFALLGIVYALVLASF